MVHEQILITCNVYFAYCAALKVFLQMEKQDYSCHYFLCVLSLLATVYKFQTESQKRGAKHQQTKNRRSDRYKKKHEENTTVKQRNRQTLRGKREEKLKGHDFKKPHPSGCIYNKVNEAGHQTTTPYEHMAQILYMYFFLFQNKIMRHCIFYILFLHGNPNIAILRVRNVM